jgi:glucokinase
VTAIHGTPRHLTAPLVVGVDIGGTKTAILVCEADGTVRGRHVAPTAVGAPDKAADAIDALVRTALEEAGARRGCRAIGSASRVADPTRHITRRSTWTGTTCPRAGLEARLGVMTVLENDVRAAALGLHRRRIFGDTATLALLAIGTGISAGVVIDGVLHRGADGLAGEIGHVVIDRNGPACPCGMRGCFEVVAAGPAIVRRATEGWAAEGRSGAELHPIGAEAVFAAAEAGDPVARTSSRTPAGRWPGASTFSP